MPRIIKRCLIPKICIYRNTLYRIISLKTRSKQATFNANTQVENIL